MPGELGFDTGPYVNIAAFCERVLDEKDGVLSLIRVVDQISVQAEGPDAPDELPSGVVATATLVVSLRAGEARGAQIVKVSLELPDGSSRDGPEVSVPFPGGTGSGANLVVPMAIQVEMTGLYWAQIYVNRRLMARVPLEINYGFTRQPAAPP